MNFLLLWNSKENRFFSKQWKLMGSNVDLNPIDFHWNILQNIFCCVLQKKQCHFHDIRGINDGIISIFPSNVGRTKPGSLTQSWTCHFTLVYWSTWQNHLYQAEYSLLTNCCDKIKPRAWCVKVSKYACVCINWRIWTYSFFFTAMMCFHSY